MHARANGSGQRIHAQDLLNRRVRAKNGRVIGRIEELRVQRHAGRYEVTTYLMGAGGLFERLAIAGRRLFGQAAKTVVARWDQIDVSDPEQPRLTCDRGDLRTE